MCLQKISLTFIGITGPTATYYYIGIFCNRIRLKVTSYRPLTALRLQRSANEIHNYKRRLAEDNGIYDLYLRTHLYRPIYFDHMHDIANLYLRTLFNVSGYHKI